MYKSNLTNAITDYNVRNPTLRKLTLTSIAKQIGCSQPYLSGIGKSKEFQEIGMCVFSSTYKKDLKAFWFTLIEHPKKTVLMYRIEAIRKILGCEIYDLIKKV